MAAAVGLGPLGRAMRRAGFPRASPLDVGLAAPGAGACLHLPELGCPRGEDALLEALAVDVEACGAQLGLHRSGKHLQVYGEALKGSRPFTMLVARLLSTFGLTLVDCWVNLYRDGADGKSWHHDNFRDRAPQPTVTIGLSLGETRDLAFQEVATGREFRVPQENGDVFAFDQSFNRHFKHSVPHTPSRDPALRMSVIIWANEDERVPSMVRTKLAVMREEVALNVSWEDWDLSDPDCWAPSAGSHSVTGFGAPSPLEIVGHVDDCRQEAGEASHRSVAALCARPSRAPASPASEAQPRRWTSARHGSLGGGQTFYQAPRAAATTDAWQGRGRRRARPAAGAVWRPVHQQS